MEGEMALRYSLWILLTVGGIALAGCANVQKIKPVASGDLVGVHFTCRLKNGDIAISTSKEVTENAALSKSAIFVPRNDEGALAITAGSDAQEHVPDDIISFEDRAKGMIAAAVVGMTPGEKHTVRLRAERKDKDHNGQENTIKINRITHRPREMEMARGEFLARTGKAPLLDEEIDLGEGIMAKVLSMSGDKVNLRVSATADALIRTPFGPGKVTETPTDLEIVVDAPIGGLVRTGPLVGRIAALDDNSITLDYGHPFGGEELTCEVIVEPAAKAADKGDEHAEK
jgi:FKBP-type peptidyl-prolyl cis-trans isomerase 2